jgi:hypothetical protein
MSSVALIAVPATASRAVSDALTRVAAVRTLRPENALTPKLVRREAVQLFVVAALSVLALVFGPNALRVAAAVVDIVAALLTFVAGAVAWNAVGISKASAVYAVSVVVFTALAIANLLT